MAAGIMIGLFVLAVALFIVAAYAPRREHVRVWGGRFGLPTIEIRVGPRTATPRSIADLAEGRPSGGPSPLDHVRKFLARSQATRSDPDDVDRAELDVDAIADAPTDSHDDDRGVDDPDTVRAPKRSVVAWLLSRLPRRRRAARADHDELDGVFVDDGAARFPAPESGPEATLGATTGIAPSVPAPAIDPAAAADPPPIADRAVGMAWAARIEPTRALTLDEAVRAIDLLGTLGEPWCAELLVEALGEERGAEQLPLRLAVLRAMRNARYAEAREAIIDGPLFARDPVERIAAVETLAAIGARDAVEIALTDEDAVAAAAAMALCKGMSSADAEAYLARYVEPERVPLLLVHALGALA